MLTKVLSKTATRRKVACLIAASFVISSCSSRSETISAQYVSPLQYQSYSCSQVRMEMQRVGRKVNEVAGVQDSEATKDSVAMGVGLIVFWPALFFMVGQDKEQELSRLKGEFEALEQTAIQKECDVANELAKARQLQNARKSKGRDTDDELGSGHPTQDVDR